MTYVWNALAEQTLRQMRADHSVDQIAEAIGCSRSTIYGRLSGKKFTPEHRSAINERYRSDYPARADEPEIIHRPTPEMLRERDGRVALPHRDLTGALMGDPPIGLSALEGRR